MTGWNLTVDTIVPYLLERELVSVGAIVDGDLEVIDAGRRNQNLKVVRRSGPSYVIKQPGEGELATDVTLQAEAAFYSHCHTDPSAADLRAFLPGLHSCDAARGLLVIDLVEGQPLWGRYAATPSPESLADAAGPVGDAIGTLHRVFRDPASRTAPWIAGLTASPPWVFGAHRPTPDVFASLSPANLQLLRLLQKGALAAGLGGLHAEWAPDTLIHNDLKGDNILVSTNPTGQPQVRIVDWEMIQVGDAAWDVGAVLRDFLGYWLLSVPLTADLTAEQMLEAASWPLAKLHPGARAFWQAYRRSAQLEGGRAGDFLVRSVRFAAARMAQAAYELCLTEQQPSNLAMAMLQLAANILSDPREASLHLFGIPAPWKKPEHAAIVS
jgi:Ser/Thr protein kinase RdoA (MazF antagonist)